jgi:hypothetical protein
MKTPIYGFCHPLVSGSSHNLLSVGDASNPGAVHNDMGLSESERCQKSQTVETVMGKSSKNHGKGYG